MAFFEIRQYKIRPGKMSAWLELMQTEVMPFQISKGVVLCGSYQAEDDDTAYFWIRRFESEAERERIYEAIYQSDEWLNDFAPRIEKVMDRSGMVVHRVVATSMSPLQ